MTNWVLDREGNLVLAQDERQTIICTLVGSCRNPDVLRDALKITAAPDLLKAAEMARDILSYIAEKAPDPAGMALIALNKCDAAIAKATGTMDAES